MLVFPDPEIEVRRYLLPLLTGMFPNVKITTEVPATTDWTQKPWLCVLTVSGNGKRVGRVFESVIIGAECFAPTKGEASKMSAFVRALLEVWPQSSGRVAGFSDNARPQDSTDINTKYPSYWYSANLLFKAETTQ